MAAVLCGVVWFGMVLMGFGWSAKARNFRLDVSCLSIHSSGRMGFSVLRGRAWASSERIWRSDVVSMDAFGCPVEGNIAFCSASGYCCHGGQTDSSDRDGKKRRNHRSFKCLNTRHSNGHMWL